MVTKIGGDAYHHVPMVSDDVPSMNAFIECVADGLSSRAFAESQVIS